MDSLFGFKSFREKSLDEQIVLQKIDYSNWRGRGESVDEDISRSEKKNKILLLKKLLSNFDKYFHYSDDPRVYRKGKSQQDEIEKLVKELGKDGSRIYKKFFEQNESKTKDDENKRTKKEKEEDDELVDVKPKIKEVIDYMNPRNWFPDMSGVKATGSLNKCDTEKNEKGKAISYMSDGGNLALNRPKFVPPTDKRIKDLKRQRTI